MDHTSLRMCAYLDEAGEEPISSLDCLNQYSIKNVILREAWSSNICKASDNGHKKLAKLLNDYGINTVFISSILGRVPVDALLKITDNEIKNTINVCKYYNCNKLKIYLGEANFQERINKDIINNWTDRIINECQKNNIRCLYEINRKSAIFDVIDVAKLLNDFPIKLIYDAPNIISRYNMNPFVKYWPLVKNYTEIIDIRDLKIGGGYKPVGYGDTCIDLTIKDAIDSKFNGWYALEPTLGRKHGSAIGKNQTFAHSVEALDKVLR